MRRPAAFERFRPVLEEELKKAVDQGKSPLYDMLRYQMGWVDEMRAIHLLAPGDRVHGTLCLLVAETVGAEHRCALPGAVGVELAQGFAQVHEDLRLGSPERGSRPATWWVWGHSQGINAGDGMYALARLAVMGKERQGATAEAALEAVITLDRYCLELAEHQFLDTEMQDQPPMGVPEHLRIVQGTDGALMGCAAELGARSGSASEEAIQAFALFGRKVGIAFRIRRDIDALWDGTPASRSHVVDILDRKRSLPLLQALQAVEGGDRRLVNELSSRERAMEDKDIDELLGAFDRAGARRFAEEAAARHTTEGIEALAGSGVGPPALAELEAMARYLAGPQG